MNGLPYPPPLGYVSPYPLLPVAMPMPQRITAEAAMAMANKAGVEIERDGSNLRLTVEREKKIPPAVIEAVREAKPHIRWRLRKAEMLAALDEAQRYGLGLHVKHRQLFTIGVAPSEVFDRLYEHWDAITAMFIMTPELAAIFSPERIELRSGQIMWRRGNPIH